MAFRDFVTVEGKFGQLHQVQLADDRCSSSVVFVLPILKAIAHNRALVSVRRYFVSPQASGVSGCQAPPCCCVHVGGLAMQLHHLMSRAGGSNCLMLRSLRKPSILLSKTPSRPFFPSE